MVCVGSVLGCVGYVGSYGRVYGRVQGLKAEGLRGSRIDGSCGKVWGV